MYFKKYTWCGIMKYSYIMPNAMENKYRLSKVNIMEDYI